jgi:hypothetical protein
MSTRAAAVAPPDRKPKAAAAPGMPANAKNEAYIA